MQIKNQSVAPVIAVVGHLVGAASLLWGWVLKTVKESSRMTKRVKNFLKSMFIEGARSGQKLQSKLER